MTIAEIIKRLEAGETGREIDEAICDATGVRLEQHRGVPNHAGWAILRHTTSLDAALTLVPEGWHWTIYDTDGLGKGCAEVEPPEYSYEPLTGIAKTPAIALCIAALKAREAQP